MAGKSNATRRRGHAVAVRPPRVAVVVRDAWELYEPIRARLGAPLCASRDSVDSDIQAKDGSRCPRLLGGLIHHQDQVGSVRPQDL